MHLLIFVHHSIHHLYIKQCKGCFGYLPDREGKPEQISIPVSMAIFTSVNQNSDRRRISR